MHAAPASFEPFAIFSQHDGFALSVGAGVGEGVVCVDVWAHDITVRARITANSLCFIKSNLLDEFEFVWGARPMVQRSSTETIEICL